MSTKAQAARINGALSNGPVTEAGKAIAAQNSLKHGLTSSRIVLPGESQDEYDRLEASFVRRFRPVDELEKELVVEMAASRWRLRRIQAMESALFKKAIREQQELLCPDADADDVRDAAYAQVAESKTLRQVTRHSGQLRRSYEKAWKELEKLRQDGENEKEQNEPKIRLTEAMLDFLTAPPPIHRPHMDVAEVRAVEKPVMDRAYKVAG